MLRSLKDLQGYSIEARDGHLGHVHEFYFDDDAWMVRYVVVDTGSWLPGRKVLLAPEALGTPEWPRRVIPVELTKHQIEHSPAPDEHRPVSRQHEARLHSYFGWQPYWTDPLLYGHEAARVYDQSAGVAVAAESGDLESADREAVAVEERPEDRHLQSSREVIGYHIHATDGEIGHVEDFIVLDRIWCIRYVVVDLHNWRPGEKVLVSPQWIESVDWTDLKVRVEHTREELRHAPRFDPAEPVNREYETRLYDYYGRPRQRI